MVLSLSTSLLLPAELGETIDRYSTAVTASGIEEPILNKIFTLFSADLQELNTAIAAIRYNSKVDEVAAADAFRDDMFIGFRDMVGAYRRRRKPELITAYEKVWGVIEKIGTMAYRLGYTQQSGKMAALFAELDQPENQAYLTTLSVLEIYTELKDAEAEFKIIFKSRLDEDTQNQYPTLQEAKNKALPHVNSFIGALTILEELEPDIYKNLVDQINVITEQVMIIAKARKTRKENETQDEG